jgi:hypothetical protein
MDASSYALTHGIRATRGALTEWQARPWSVLRVWLLGSLMVAVTMLGVIWVIAMVSTPHGAVLLNAPPFVAGSGHDVLRILGHNMLVLALHAMACVAGFIAGSSLPLQAEHHAGVIRVIHERGRPVALGFVVCATAASLTMQAYFLGTGVGAVAATVHRSAALVMVGLMPHALPELVALFLPLAAWLVASRRGEWDRLLAATVVTVAVAVPVLVLTALWEVYGAPHLLSALLGYA